MYLYIYVCITYIGIHRYLINDQSVNESIDKSIYHRLSNLIVHNNVHFIFIHSFMYVFSYGIV